MENLHTDIRVKRVDTIIPEKLNVNKSLKQLFLAPRFFYNNLEFLSQKCSILCQTKSFVPIGA